MSLQSRLIELLIKQQRQLIDLLGAHGKDVDRSAPEPREEDPDRIASYVRAEVRAGRVAPENAARLERALHDEAAGKTIIMRKPHIVRRLPRSPEQARAVRTNGGW
jgi:hypothetical protein